MSTGRRFVFAPLERRGLLLGLAPIQLAFLAGGALVALVVVHTRSSGAGIVTALIVAAGAAGGACLPVVGRPPVVWLPVVAGWILRRSRGPSLERTPTYGWVTPRGGASPVTPGLPPERPSALLGSGIEILAARAAPGQPAMGVVRDQRGGTWAAVLPVRGRAFALLDPAEKERRLGAWGSVLVGIARAGSPVHRLQWVERSFAGDGDALTRYLAEAGGAEAGGAEAGRKLCPGWSRATPRDAARAAYAELIAEAGPATLEHESLVVLAIHPRRSSRAVRTFGRGPDAIVGLLRREIRLLQGQLRAAELVTGDPLDETGMAMALRNAVEPEARRRAASGRRGQVGAWPLATDEAWSCLRADGAWHATFWVAEWPRLEVGPDFLAPLLLAGGRRTVSVTLAPVPPERARRQVEAARTADAADDELRQRAGFLPTARRRREAEGVARREAELADGHAEFRFSGYVTVSGPDRQALEAACAEIEQVAQQSRIELRRLFGQQKEAFAWTLPLARGLA